MAKKFFFVCLGMLALAGAYSLVSDSVPPPAIGAEGEVGHGGRFQLFQGNYRFHDYKKDKSATFDVVFRIDTMTGEVSELTVAIDKRGTLLNYWAKCGDKIPIFLDR